MEKPFLTIKNKKVYAVEPKMKTWREFLKLQEENTFDKPLDEYITNALNIIVCGFNNPKVTVEVLEENLDISDILPKVKELINWMQGLTFAKLAQLPNEQAVLENN